jgi:hypothetical protein
MCLFSLYNRSLGSTDKQEKQRLTDATPGDALPAMFAYGYSGRPIGWRKPIIWCDCETQDMCCARNIMSGFALVLLGALCTTALIPFQVEAVGENTIAECQIIGFKYPGEVKLLTVAQPWLLLLEQRTNTKRTKSILRKPTFNQQRCDSVVYSVYGTIMPPAVMEMCQALRALVASGIVPFLISASHPRLPVSRSCVIHEYVHFTPLTHNDITYELGYQISPVFILAEYILVGFDLLYCDTSKLCWQYSALTVCFLSLK